MRSIAITVAFAMGCAPPLHPKELPAIEPANLISAETYTARIADLRATLARNGVELDTEPVIRHCAPHAGKTQCLRCDVASRSDTANVDPEMIDGIAIAFARYPDRMIAATKLRHVALCRKIRYENEDPDSGPAGVAITSDHRLLVSIEHFIGKPHDAYDYFTIEQVVHHELFHLLEFDLLGERMMTDDAEWHALNPPGFQYRDPATADARPAGFVNIYATTNEAEDRASVFEYVMGQPTKLCTLAQTDRLVMAKTTTVWNRVVKLMGSKLLERDAPCLAALRSGKQPKQIGPQPKPPDDPEKPTLRPSRRPRKSLVGKMR